MEHLPSTINKNITEITNTVWNKKNHRIVLLFVIAALLVLAFTYHQYIRRHGAISSNSQKKYNQNIKHKIDHLHELKRKLKTLQQFNGDMEIEEDIEGFQRTVKELGI